MKKTLLVLTCLILTISLLMIPVIASESSSFSVSDSAVTVGDTFDVTVSISRTENVGRIGIIPTFDKNTFEFVSGCWLVDGALSDADISKTGAALLAFEGTETVDGAVYSFTLKVKDTAAVGSYEIGGTVNTGESIPVTSAGVMVVSEGTAVAGKVTSYNPTNDTLVELCLDGVTVASTTIPAAEGEGAVTQPFVISDIAPGTYDLKITKDCHLEYLITGVVVESGILDLTQNDDPEIANITLLAGNVNGDLVIDIKDVILLTSSLTYSQSYEDGETKTADINGDKCFDIKDLVIITSDVNYNKGKKTVAYVPNKVPIDSGECGDNLTWTLYEDGELAIGGTGEMWDYNWEYDSKLYQFVTTAPWGKYYSVVTKLTIAEGVTSIGNAAFISCSGFTGNLVIPDSVTTIGDRAFSSCEAFSGDLVIPDSLTTIGENAFEFCTGFTGNLVIGNGITTISQYAFFGCSGFVGNLMISESVKEIGECAFASCSGFTGNLVIPDSVTTIGDRAFSSCEAFSGDLIIPDSVTSIGGGAFDHCSGFTGKLVISNNVTRIKGGTFNFCSGLTGELVIPDSVTEIGARAFADCSGFTGDLIISDNVARIDTQAFSGCSGLSKIVVHATNANFSVNVFDDTGSAFEIHGYAGSTAETYANKNGHKFVVISVSAADVNGDK
ncbi:MAG: hypothetical protein E7627_04010 [Ruminococcaceae bacterium]|nr:hypothetical protein [Oscillospiraceae bacterium]